MVRDAEILQHGNAVGSPVTILIISFPFSFSSTGKAKNLVEMWKTMDKENTPPPERRGPRALTPPMDNERRLPIAQDVRSIRSNVKDDPLDFSG